MAKVSEGYEGRISGKVQFPGPFSRHAVVKAGSAPKAFLAVTVRGISMIYVNHV